jgi:hypothetical protein
LRDVIKPPPRISGTHARECPKCRISLHIRAYFQVTVLYDAATKPLQAGTFARPLTSETGPIAMQKVVGSNPISRFFTCKSTLFITTMNLSDGAFSTAF